MVRNHAPPLRSRPDTCHRFVLRSWPCKGTGLWSCCTPGWQSPSRCSHKACSLPWPDFQSTRPSTRGSSSHQCSHGNASSGPCGGRSSQAPRCRHWAHSGMGDRVRPELMGSHKSRRHIFRICFLHGLAGTPGKCSRSRRPESQLFGTPKGNHPDLNHLGGSYRACSHQGSPGVDCHRIPANTRCSLVPSCCADTRRIHQCRGHRSQHGCCSRTFRSALREECCSPGGTQVRKAHRRGRRTQPDTGTFRRTSFS